MHLILPALDPRNQMVRQHDLSRGQMSLLLLSAAALATCTGEAATGGVGSGEVVDGPDLRGGLAGQEAGVVGWGFAEEEADAEGIAIEGEAGGLLEKLGKVEGEVVVRKGGKKEE